MHGPQMTMMPFISTGMMPRLMYMQDGTPIMVQVPVPVMVPYMGMPTPSAGESDVSSVEEAVVEETRAKDLDMNNRNLIVNGLTSWMDVDWLENTFKQYGELDTTHVVCDITTGRSKGYGFVKYANGKSADAAIRSLNGTMPKNSTKQLKVSVARQQEVSPDKQSVNVYISGFKDYLNQATLTTMCSKYGTVVDCKVLCMKHHSDGVAFVRFSTVSEASRCCSFLDRNSLQIGNNDAITFVARFADKLGKSRQVKPESECPKLLRKQL
eukprot:TRINITY_DN4260_c0_g1_i3.p1 TRINITY_DN4260_c0_g1~~TRINITY_DN4260_c0_g1_i3.p1  ORF type:complete len:268 (+),score=53.04 TRINITY_DN4260_c0_g1_i3:63-866(+)